MKNTVLCYKNSFFKFCVHGHPLLSHTRIHMQTQVCTISLSLSLSPITLFHSPFMPPVVPMCWSRNIYSCWMHCHTFASRSASTIWNSQVCHSYPAKVIITIFELLNLKLNLHVNKSASMIEACKSEVNHYTTSWTASKYTK